MMQESKTMLHIHNDSLLVLACNHLAFCHLWDIVECWHEPFIFWEGNESASLLVPHTGEQGLEQRHRPYDACSVPQAWGSLVVALPHSVWGDFRVDMVDGV